MAEPSRVRLRPMTQDEYVAWREQSVRDYAADIATSRDLEPAAAEAQSAGEFAQLLPDGLASPGMHLWTAVVDEGAGDEAVGIGWFELRQRASGVSAGSTTSASTPPGGVRGWGEDSSTPCTTLPATWAPPR